MSLSERMMTKAFGELDRASAMLGLLREVDLTTKWPGYYYGMFGTACTFPKIGIVIGTGEDSISYNTLPFQEDDLWVTLRSPRHFEVRKGLEARIGPIPTSPGEEPHWISKFIDFATRDILCIAIKYALEKQMWRFFAEIEMSHENWYPDEVPSLREQFTSLKKHKIDYAEQFEAVIWSTFKKQEDF